MDLTNINTIKNLCRQHNIKPRRERGQNFLIDKNIVTKLIGSADLMSKDTVLEVGAGFGVITQSLAQKVKKVIGVELDRNLIPVLRDNTREFKNIEIVNKDILKLKLVDYGLKNREYKVVANLPYSITSRFIRNALSIPPKPQDMTLIIQREVADRICAKAGEDMSLLSVSVQFYAEPEIVSNIKPESFWPSPEVESAIIKITNVKTPTNVNEKRFFQIARVGFSARRKMLKNNLTVGLKIDAGEVERILESIGLSKTVRAQDLSVEDWINLTRKIYENKY